jgi:hypothetical protein
MCSCVGGVLVSPAMVAEQVMGQLARRGLKVAVASVFVVFCGRAV